MTPPLFTRKIFLTPLFNWVKIQQICLKARDFSPFLGVKINIFQPLEIYELSVEKVEHFCRFKIILHLYLSPPCSHTPCPSVLPTHPKMGRGLIDPLLGPKTLPTRASFQSLSTWRPFAHLCVYLSAHCVKAFFRAKQKGKGAREMGPQRQWNACAVFLKMGKDMQEEKDFYLRPSRQVKELC